MMAKLTILLCLIVVGFSIGADALKCYDYAYNPMTCRGENVKCVQILSDGGIFMESPLHWMSFGCSEPCALLDVQDISVMECEECDTDLCNKKKVLQCYSSEKKMPVECSPGEECITLKSTDGGADVRKCGNCKNGDKNCVACNTYRCNSPPLTCSGSVFGNGKAKCDKPAYQKCLKVFKGKEWNARPCSKCSFVTAEPEDCYECDTDMCNEKEEPPKAEKCLNNINQPEVCKHPNKCFTIMRGENVIDKGCGGCRSDKIRLGETCVDCNENECNNDKPVESITTNTPSTESSTSASTTTTEKEVEPTTPSGGGTDPYNGGMINRLQAMAFCLPLVIAACLVMMSTFIGV